MLIYAVINTSFKNETNRSEMKIFRQDFIYVCETKFDEHRPGSIRMAEHDESNGWFSNARDSGLVLITLHSVVYIKGVRCLFTLVYMRKF
jgi:hypothetical protein